MSAGRAATLVAITTTPAALPGTTQVVAASVTPAGVDQTSGARLLALGLAQHQLDQLAEAEETYKRAILTDTGDWLGGLRLKLSLYGEVLMWQGKVQAAREIYAAAVTGGVFEHLLERPMLPTPDSRVGGRKSAWYNDTEIEERFPRLDRVRRLLEAAADDVRSEYLAYKAAHPNMIRAHPDALVAMPRDGWAQLPLGEAKGGATEDGAAQDCRGLCPRAAALLREVQQVLCFGRICPRSAEFSILRAGTKLRPHCGPTNLSLTLHLGIVCPGNGRGEGGPAIESVDDAHEKLGECSERPCKVASCRGPGPCSTAAELVQPPDVIGTANASLVEVDRTPPSTLSAQFCIAGECRPWREGRLMVFNEAFEHEAWGPHAGDRVVLLFKIPHPGLPEEVYDKLYDEYLGNSSILHEIRTQGEVQLLGELAR